MSIRAARISVFAIMFACGLISANNAFADVVFTVDSILDQIDDDTSDGICHTTANTCTLRAAVMSANKAGGNVLIVLPAGTYTLIRPSVLGDSGGAIKLLNPVSGTPTITIDGAGAAVTIIDANEIADHVLTIDSSRTATISGVTFRNGHVSGDGGGIYNAGNLDLIGCTLSDNTASGNGGGIYTSQILFFNQSTLSGNQALSGGGIYSSGGSSVTAGDCTLSGNTTLPGGSGGGIYTEAASSTTIDHCTLSGNMADELGGGIANNGSVDISYTTLSGNTAAKFVGGGLVSSGVLTLKHSTVSGNTAAIAGGIYSAGTGTLSQSTISGNTVHTYGTVPSNGGGIYVYDGVLTVTNSTIALNNADADGGGIYNDVGSNTNVNIYSSTIAYNGAASLGGGIFLNGTDGNGFNLYNTILAENSENNFLGLWDDCTAGNNGISTGVLKTHARNLFGNGINCTIAAVSGSYSALNPLASLGGLQNNGGPTKTIALLASSNAIDGTSVTGFTCGDGSGQILVDQRGYPRTGACDVGAFEYDDIFSEGFE
jgi:predicted outer membrane repeat protein